MAALNDANSLEQFQAQVSDVLFRHKSVLDIMSKLGQTSAAVNRSVTKAITDCGCIELNAKKQHYGMEETLSEAQQKTESHVNGELCEQCLEVVQNELGRNLFYMTALCSQLKIDMMDVLHHESKKCSTLGLFNLR